MSLPRTAKLASFPVNLFSYKYVHLTVDIIPIFKVYNYKYMKYYKIGELAKQAGISSSAIRYYERIGVLPKPALTDSGYRMYDEYSIKSAKFIKHAKELGFSLKEIEELLSLRLNENNGRKRPKDSCDRVRAMAEIKISEIGKKISSMRKIKDKLVKLKNLCGTNNNNGKCPVIDILED